LIEVIDDRQTGETILDEALKMMKSSEKYGTGAWIDLMSGESLRSRGGRSVVMTRNGGTLTGITNPLLTLASLAGETWNVMKIGYQLKQVRERLAKGLVDKGVLRTEKRNFLLFDMATHPIADLNAKEDVLRRTLALLTAKTTALPPAALHKENVQYRTMRAVALVSAAYAANVLENALQRLNYDAREAAFARCDDILAEFSQWPFGAGTSTESGPVNIGGGPSKRTGILDSLAGASGGGQGRESVAELVREVRKEMQPGAGEDGEDLCFEVVATVMNVMSNMDAL
jgi:Golgi phosphoprotein 3